MNRLRKGRSLLVAVVAVAASLAAGGYGYAALTGTNNVYTGCLNGGKIVNVAIGSAPRARCVSPAVKISWNRQGTPGTPGTPGMNGTNGVNGESVTSSALSAGDPNCPNGGSKFTAKSGVTYACNGAPGAAGTSTTAVYVQPPGGGTSHRLLSVPGLGEFDTTCGGAGPAASLTYVNTSAATVDWTLFISSFYSADGSGVQQSGTSGGELTAGDFKEIFLPTVITDGGQFANWQLNTSGGTNLATVETSILFDSSGNCVFRASAS